MLDAADVVVFTGPTISAAAAAEILPATYLPPVCQGDVLRVSRRSDRPARVIAIIDGTFDRMPAVWHKEILWAMARGIHVFGCSSMGALRAAELAAFGMQGRGKIFQAFHAGELDDDEEVVVAHGEASAGYRAASEAMVNVRATCAEAVARGVISAATREALESTAKGIFYPGRTYAAILARSRGDVRSGARGGVSDNGLVAAEVDAFERFLVEGRVDQKRLDAIELLTHLRDEGEALRRPRRPSFAFEHTDTWDQAMASAGAADASPASPGTQPVDALATRLAEELRLRPDYEMVRRGALLRAVAAEESRRHGLAVDEPLRDATQESFRRQRELLDDRSIWGWLGDNGLGETDFGRLLDGEARLRWFEALHAQDTAGELAAEMIALGILPAVRARAEHKLSVLMGAGLAEPELADVPLGAEALLTWYFEERLGHPVPPDLKAYLAGRGLPDEAALAREARRELLYLRLTGRATGNPS
jgi:hypothetical protein